MPTPFTLILPYYRQPRMLAYQLSILASYPLAVSVVIVDDGSPEPALPLAKAHNAHGYGPLCQLYRVLEDEPWNREMARNLGASVADTPWIVQLDLDHVLPAQAASALMQYSPQPGHWYRFPRYRKGRADATRRKDQLPDGCEFGAIHPHVDSYLVERDTYWATGGYDEVFCGVLGGGGEFLARLEREAGPPLLLPEECALHVLTRSVVADASDQHCNRDTAPGKALWRAKQAQGLPKPTSWLHLPWERQL